MKRELTINDLKRGKRALETEINDCIKQFEEAFGVSVESVNSNTIIDRKIGGGLVTLHDTKVRLEI